jgi:DNA-directed RNA polymerase subunit N
VIIPVRCFSCGKVIGDAYEEYKQRYIEYKKTVDSGENPKETPKKILDDLGVDRYCCRRMIITHVDLLEESAPYE